MDRAAIRHHHSEAGHANPADNEGVRHVMRGLTRRAAQEGGRVDVALISVMRDAMLRRGEAAALTWADVVSRATGPPGPRWTALEEVQDGNGDLYWAGTPRRSFGRSTAGAFPRRPVLGCIRQAVSKRSAKGPAQGRGLTARLLGPLAAHRDGA